MRHGQFIEKKVQNSLSLKQGNSVDLLGRLKKKGNSERKSQRKEVLLISIKDLRFIDKQSLFNYSFTQPTFMSVYYAQALHKVSEPKAIAHLPHLPQTELRALEKITRIMKADTKGSEQEDLMSSRKSGKPSGREEQTR